MELTLLKCDNMSDKHALMFHDDASIVRIVSSLQHCIPEGNCHKCFKFNPFFNEIEAKKLRFLSDLINKIKPTNKCTVFRV